MPFCGKKNALILSLFCAAGVIVLLAGGMARGALVTIGIAGDVTAVSGPDEQVKVGDTFSGSYTYDSSAADLNPSDTAIGSYQFKASTCGISLSFNMGELIFASDPESVNFDIEVNHDGGSTDRYLITSTSNLPVNGEVISNIFWQIEYNNSGIFTSDALPLTAPDLNKNDLTSNILRIDGEMHTSIRAEVTKTYIISIPEPASAFLIAVGCLFAGLRRRWR